MSVVDLCMAVSEIPSCMEVDPIQVCLLLFVCSLNSFTMSMFPQRMTKTHRCLNRCRWLARTEEKHPFIMHQSGGEKINFRLYFGFHFGTHRNRVQRASNASLCNWRQSPLGSDLPRSWIRLTKCSGLHRNECCSCMKVQYTASPEI